MTFLAFLGALSLSLLAFELMSVFQTAFSTFGGNRLMNMQANTSTARRSTWEALLVAILPGRFDPDQAKTIADVISLLRRAGYPYDTPGEFYAVAIRDFSIFLAVGGLLAGALAVVNIIAAAPVIAMIFIFLGLRRPYVRLKTLAKKRAEALRNNMLIGLSVLSALLSSGVGVQEALRRAASVGGPFCNLLGLLVARMEVEDFTKAVEVTRAHLPDPADVEANLFLRDIYDFFANNRPVLSSIQGLQESVHRTVVEMTEARAALVRQRSGLFGVLAVVGLVLAIIAPFTPALASGASVGAGLI
jgi:Flp pilus assembly protein TadB